MKEESLYGAMGVDAHKEAIGETFKPIINTIFPNAWVNITRDHRAPGYVRTLKVDGDGSRPTQNCLHYMETGDPRSLEPSADDDFAMVAADMGAAGFVDEILYADALDVNRFPIPGLKKNLIKSYKRRIAEVIELHRRYGFFVEFFGGETADLPSQVTTYTSNGFAFGRTHEKFVIEGKTQPGDSIWGFASGGQAIWEKERNSGLMCNGLTLGCAVLMSEKYNEKYPFLRHEKQKYRGRFKVNDTVVELDGMTVSEALRSPTRQWAIIFRLLIDELVRREALHLLHGLTVNTGGGASKIIRLGENITYFKEMPPLPPIFQLICEEGGVPGQEMYEDFNCGVGADVIGSGEGGILEDAIRVVSEQSGVAYWLLGECYEWSASSGNHVLLQTPLGSCQYPQNG